MRNRFWGVPGPKLSGAHVPTGRCLPVCRGRGSDRAGRLSLQPQMDTSPQARLRHPSFSSRVACVVDAWGQLSSVLAALFLASLLTLSSPGAPRGEGGRSNLGEKGTGACSVCGGGHWPGSVPTPGQVAHPGDSDRGQSQTARAFSDLDTGRLRGHERPGQEDPDLFGTSPPIPAHCTVFRCGGSGRTDTRNDRLNRSVGLLI